MEVSVMQWNVWFKQDIDEVVDFLKANPADIICLQELTRGYVEQTRENTWEFIAHAIGYEVHVQEIPIITPDAQWSQANAIFSKFPILSKVAGWIHEPEDPESLTDQYRGYLEIDVDTGSGPLTIATTHMSFRPHGEPEGDLELQQLLTHTKDREHYVMTGDLNVTPEHYRIAELLKHLRNAGPDFTEYTWPTKPFEHDGIILGGTPDRRLDYILASKDVKVKGSGLLQTDISDHLPAFVTVELVTA